MNRYRDNQRRRNTASRVLLAFGLALGPIGCAPRIEVVRAPEPFVATESLARPMDAALALDALTLTTNGVEVTPSDQLTQHLATRFRDARLFKTVYAPADAELAPPGSAHAHCGLVERTDDHALANTAKLMASAATLFLLLPFLPYDYDVESTLTCEITLPDGATLREQASSAMAVRLYPPSSRGYVVLAAHQARLTAVDAVMAGLRSHPTLVAAARAGS